MLQTLFESALDAIIVLDDQRRCLDVNPAACRLFGIWRDELLGRRVDEFVEPDAALDVAWPRLLVTGHDSGDATIRSVGGRTVQVEYRAKANFLPGRHLAVLRDVTDRRRTERKVRADAEFLRRLIESSQDCIKVLDLEGRLLSMNDGGRRLLEIDSLAPYIGHSWLDLWRGGDMDRAADALARARQGAAVTFEGFAATSAGTPKWWETAIAPINGADGRPERLLAISRDISARVRADHERAFLARATQHLAMSLDVDETLRRIVEVAVPFLADFAFLEITENDGAHRAAWTHGDPAQRSKFEDVARRFPPPRAIQRPVAGVVQGAHTCLVPEVTAAWMEEAATSAEHLGFMRSLGTRSLISVRLAEHDQVIGVLTLATAQPGRRYDAQHLALAEQLALRAVIAVQNARLYAAAQRAQEASEAASRAKNEFLAMLAHELRNPLAAIINGVTALNHIGAISPEARQARGVIRRQTEHLAGLLDDLLDVARIGQGKLELSLEPLDLRTIVERAFEAEGHRFVAKDQHVTIELAPEPVVVRGDAVRLRQIVANLLNNASKYTGPAGVITVAVLTDASDGVVRVRDNGIGIPREKVSTIFELFTQLHPGTSRTEGGLGIGLTLVKRLTDLHGGTITAISEGERKGSEFVVRLPLFVGIVPEKEPVLAPSQVLRYRMLVIEDDLDVRKVLALSLELAGHEVFVAGSAREGLETAVAERPAVIIVDIGLPDADGYEVARRLREALGRDPVLVAFSGHGQPEDRRRSKDAGFDDHVVKPVALETLLSVLASHSPVPLPAREGSNG